MILDFRGPGGAWARRSLIKNISGSVRLLDKKKFRKAGGTGRKQGITTGCTKLGCDAVLTGAVSRVGRRRYRAVVSVFDGGTGRLLGRHVARPGPKRLLKRLGARAGLKCRGWIAQGRRPEPERTVAWDNFKLDRLGKA